MGGHVIGTLVAMVEERVAIGYKAVEETLEISAHVGIDILLHDKARGRVANEKRQQPAFHAGLGCPIDDGTSDLDEAATAGVEAERSVGLAKHRQRHPQKSRRRDSGALMVVARLAMRTHHSCAFGVKIERMLADLEPALAGDSGLALLDLGIEEFLDAAALQAHQVIVVAALIELEHSLARFEVMPYQQACLLELRQHAIHRRQPDVQTFGQQLLVDVLGSQVPDLALLE